MRNLRIDTLDWLVLIAYFVVIAAVGIASGRRVKDTSNYFLGKQRFNIFLVIAQSFGVSTHAEMPVSLAGAVYSFGFPAIWFQWKNLFATPFMWLIVPIFRRIRRTTVAELVQDRYGDSIGGIYLLYAWAVFVIAMGSSLKGAAKVINQAVGGGISLNALVVVMALLFIPYSLLGGLVAAAWTDLIQGLLIITLSFLLVPLGWHAVGGMDGMRAALPPSHISLSTPQSIGLWFVLMLTLNGLVGTIAGPGMVSQAGTGKDEYTCRVGYVSGMLVKRICTLGWALVGLIAAVLVARGVFGTTRLMDPEDAFGFVCRNLLFPGALGLMIAGFMAATMAACSAFMVNSGALFTQGVFRKYLSRGSSERTYLRIGRGSAVLASIAGVFYACFLVDRVLYSFLLMETLTTYMGIPIWGGIMWRRANRWGAFAALTVSLGTNFLLYGIRHQRLDYWDPNVFAIAMVAGIVSLVIVSLLTAPEPVNAMKSFFGRLQTPTSPDVEVAVDPENPAPAESFDCDQPQRSAAEAGEQLVVVNLLQLRRASFGSVRAYRKDLLGWVAVSAVVVALVVLAWLVLHM